MGLVKHVGFHWIYEKRSHRAVLSVSSVLIRRNPDNDLQRFAYYKLSGD